MSESLSLDKSYQIGSAINDAIHSNLNIYDVGFEFTKVLFPGQTVFVSIVDNIEDGTFTWQREGCDIFYETLTYTATASYAFNSAQDPRPQKTVETKVAAVWFMNPEMVARKDQFFGTTSSQGTQLYSLPYMSKNISFIKSLVVLRDRFFHNMVFNTGYQFTQPDGTKLTANSFVYGKTPVETFSSRIIFQLQNEHFPSGGRNHRFIDEDYQYTIEDIEEIERFKRKAFTQGNKSTYYSDSNKGVPLRTSYNVKKQENEQYTPTKTGDRKSVV